MADQKTSGLTALTGASLAAADLVAVVDVSDTTLAATGTDKRMTVTELVAGLGANGVATDAELAAHEADTTSVHGIEDTSTLYRAGGTDVAVADGGTGVSTAAANRVFAGPATGADAAPSFRALVSADIPNNAADTSGNAATATLAATATTANAGDSATAFFSSGTVEAARLGSGTPSSANFLRGDSAWTALAAIAASGSASDLSAGTVPSARLGTGGVGSGGKVLADNQTWITAPTGTIGGSTGGTDKALLIANGTGGVTAQASGNIYQDADGNLILGDLVGARAVWFSAVATAPKLQRSGVMLQLIDNTGSFNDNGLQVGRIEAQDGSHPSVFYDVYIANNKTISFSDGVDFAQGIAKGAANGLRITDGSTGIGSLQAATPIDARTAAYTVLITDSGTNFHNQGATARVDLTLPSSAPVGTTYIVSNRDTDGVRVIAPTGETIRIAASESATAGRIDSTTVGDSVTLVKQTSTAWLAVAVVGAGWSVT